MKRRFAIFSALFLSLYILGGCSKDIKGPPRVNIPPTVDFVNIPVEGAKFSTDTTIYWYGTDVDGFIKYFKLAVVESTIVGSDPLAYLNRTPEDSVPWKILDVQLDNPNTKQKVKMSADVRDPVRKYVASYVFLQAVDNLGAKSSPVSRMFLKNNHFPDTWLSLKQDIRVSVRDQIAIPFVNAKSASGVNQGIRVGFVALDKIDYPRNPPPFDFQWKLFGPYDSLEMNTIKQNYVQSIFLDNYGDIYHKGDSFITSIKIDTTIDTTAIPPDTTIRSDTTKVLVDNIKAGSGFGVWSPYFYDTLLPPDLNRLVEESYNPLTNDPWISDEEVSIYDVFRKQQLPPAADTTRLAYFVIWCQSRDDSKVEDPVPAFTWVSAIEPKYERDVIIVDATNYGLIDGGNFNWPKMPGIDWGRQVIDTINGVPDTSTFTWRDWPTTVKEVYGKLINGRKPGSFDSENLLPPVKICIDSNCSTYRIIQYTRYKCTQDYFAIAPLVGVTELGVSTITLRDILKHKMILIIKDTPWGQIDFDQSLEGQYIRKAVNAGMSAWSMVRNPFADYFDWFQGVRNVPTFYALAFGVQLMNNTAWEGFATYSNTRAGWEQYGENGQIRIEDFVGAQSLLRGQFPDIMIDTALLEDRYVWYPGLKLFNFPFRWPSDGKMITGAYPEVDFVVKLYGAEPLYSYVSKYGDELPSVSYLHSSIGTDSLRIGHIENDQGTVVAVRYETPLYRTAHFSFTLLPFDSVNARQVFDEMMDWLSVQPFLTTGVPSNSGDPSFNMEKYRRFNRELDEEASQQPLGPMIRSRF